LYELHAQQRIYLDAAWWFQSEERVPYLQTLYQAVRQDRQIRIHYLRIFEPHRVAQVVAVDVLEQEVVRPEDFDLAAFWRCWCDDVERSRSDYPVTVRVAPALIPMIARRFGEWVRAVAERTPPDAEGWLTLQLSFERLEEARAQLLGFGGEIEVLAPIQLRRSLADFAAQIVGRYQATA
jgi:predicted DNA-binding transcriptional regulator YafY